MLLDWQPAKESHERANLKYMDMAKNVNLDKQVDGLFKSWGVAPLINHIPLDVHLVSSSDRVKWLEQMRVKNKDMQPSMGTFREHLGTCRID